MFNLINNFFKKMSFINYLLFNIYNSLVGLFYFSFYKKIKHNEQNYNLRSYAYKNIKNSYFDVFYKQNNFLNIDLFWVNLFSKKYTLRNSNNVIFRSFFRILSTKKGFFFNFYKFKNVSNFNNFLVNNFLIGYRFFWGGVKFWIFPLLVCFSTIYFTLVLRSLPFNKVIFGWICILMFIYWLISGFVFFF